MANDLRNAVRSVHEFRVDDVAGDPPSYARDAEVLRVSIFCAPDERSLEIRVHLGRYGVLYIWRGRVLEEELEALPSRRAAEDLLVERARGCWEAITLGQCDRLT